MPFCACNGRNLIKASCGPCAELYGLRPAPMPYRSMKGYMLIIALYHILRFGDSLLVISVTPQSAPIMAPVQICYRQCSDDEALGCLLCSCPFQHTWFHYIAGSWYNTRLAPIAAWWCVAKHTKRGMKFKSGFFVYFFSPPHVSEIPTSTGKAITMNITYISIKL